MHRCSINGSGYAQVRQMENVTCRKQMLVELPDVSWKWPWNVLIKLLPSSLNVWDCTFIIYRLIISLVAGLVKQTEATFYPKFHCTLCCICFLCVSLHTIATVSHCTRSNYLTRCHSGSVSDTTEALQKKPFTISAAPQLQEAKIDNRLLRYTKVIFFVPFHMIFRFWRQTHFACSLCRTCSDVCPLHAGSHSDGYPARQFLSSHRKR